MSYNEETASYSIYALVDPRRPQEMRYVGRTSVAVYKKVQDHISMAKFREKKNPDVLAPVMRWVLDLISEGVRPEGVILAANQDYTQSIIKLGMFIDTFPTLLNDSHGAATTGKKPGQVDSEEAKQRKREARKHSQAIAQAERIKTCAYVRKKLGYPAPEFGVYHHLNRAHHRVLHPIPTRPRKPEHMLYIQQRAREVAREFREANNLPRPDLSTNKYINKKATRQLKAEGKYISYSAWCAQRKEKTL